MTTPVFHLICHTHWDREWYLPRAAFHVRLVQLLDELVTRLAGGAEGVFLLDGQTVLVEDYLRTRPDLEAPLRFLVREGRLQVGPWYVLPDELIPSGESLVRNLQLGRADAARLGRRLDVLYSPDAFGHPACLPALAAGFGLFAIVAWRGVGSPDAVLGGKDLGRWRGSTGQAVHLFRLPISGYEVGAALAGPADRVASAWNEIRRSLVALAATRHVAVFIGADHHAAPTDFGALREWVVAAEGKGTVRFSRLDEFCAAAAAEARDLVEIGGELRTASGDPWILQGVHGTRAPAKRRNALLELWLERVAEPLAALAGTHGGRDRRPLLEQAWRTLVQCHFHDTIGGCTSDAVAAAAAARWDAVEAYGREIASAAWHELVGHDPDAAREVAVDHLQPTLLLWNPAARARGGVIVADVTFFRQSVLVGPPGGRTPRVGEGVRPFSLRTALGHPVALQILDRRIGQERLDAARHYPAQAMVDVVRVALRVPTLPGLGFGALVPGPPAETSAPEAVEVHARSLVNRFVVVTLDSSGALTLFDRRTGERWLDLLRLESGGDAGDTYTYCPPARDRPTRSRGPVRVRRLAAGPLVAALEARWTMRVPRGGRVEVRHTISLHADSPVVRCILDVANQATNHRLRARLPTGIRTIAIAGAAFGSERRRPVTASPGDSPNETPVRTAPAHRFVAVAQADRGLALLAPGFFEYEYTPRGDLLFTVLRAVGQLSRDDLPTRPGHAGWPTLTPGAQCLGPTRVELALAPLRERDLSRGDLLTALWEHAFTPIRGYWVRDAIAGGLTLPPVDVTLEGGGLVLSSVAPAADGMVLRCYNATDRPTSGAWRFGEAVRGARRTRLDGEAAVPLVLEEGGRRVRFTAAAGEIVTVAVQ